MRWLAAVFDGYPGRLRLVLGYEKAPVVPGLVSSGGIVMFGGLV